MRSLLWQPRPSITTPAFSAGDHGAPHTSQLHTCHVSRVSTPALTIGSNITIRGFVVKKVFQWKTAFQFQDEGTNFTIILRPPCTIAHLYRHSKSPPGKCTLKVLYDHVLLPRVLVSACPQPLIKQWPVARCGQQFATIWPQS